MPSLEERVEALEKEVESFREIAELGRQALIDAEAQERPEPVKPTAEEEQEIMGVHEAAMIELHELDPEDWRVLTPPE